MLLKFVADQVVPVMIKANFLLILGPLHCQTGNTA